MDKCYFVYFVTISIYYETYLLFLIITYFQTLTIAIAYFISIYILWTPQRAGLFRGTSQLLWLVITCFLASLTGSFQVYTFVFLQAICIAGFALEVLDVHKKMQLKGMIRKKTFLKNLHIIDYGYYYKQLENH